MNPFIGRPAALRTRFSGTSSARARWTARLSLMKLRPRPRAIRWMVSAGNTQPERHDATSRAEACRSD